MDPTNKTCHSLSGTTSPKISIDTKQNGVEGVSDGVEGVSVFSIMAMVSVSELTCGFCHCLEVKQGDSQGVSMI